MGLTARVSPTGARNSGRIFGGRRSGWHDGHGKERAGAPRGHCRGQRIYGGGTAPAPPPASPGEGRGPHRRGPREPAHRHGVPQPGGVPGSHLPSPGHGQAGGRGGLHLPGPAPQDLHGRGRGSDPAGDAGPGSLGRLPAEGRRGLPAVVRDGACGPAPAEGGGLRPSRTPSRRDRGGATGGGPGLLSHRRGAGPGPPHRRGARGSGVRDHRFHLRGLGRRAEGRVAVSLLRGEREPQGLRRGHPPAHPRDRAGAGTPGRPRGHGLLHAAPGAPHPRDPDHHHGFAPEPPPAGDLVLLFQTFYRGAPFVRVLAEGSSPRRSTSCTRISATSGSCRMAGRGGSSS